MRNNSEPTDYERFTAAAIELGAEKICNAGKIPGYPDENLRAECWYFNGPIRQPGEGFFIIHNRTTGKIGVYEFVGNNGASVEEDMKWLMRKYQQIQNGKAKPKAA